MTAAALVTHEEAINDLGPCLYFLNPDKQRQARMAHLLTCTACQPGLEARMEADHFDGVPACMLALIAKREITKGTITDTSLIAAVDAHFATCELHKQPGVSPTVWIVLALGLAVIALIILYVAAFR